MKKFAILLTCLSLVLSLAACSGGTKGSENSDEGGTKGPESSDEGGTKGSESSDEGGTTQDKPLSSRVTVPEGRSLVLSDEGVTLDGQALTDDPTADVYLAHDIVYYESGHDFTYGEGGEADEHDADEAAAHTVVHITQAGTYVISGKLSAGQIAVDLGEDAETDPEAVVDLVLSGADITCSVAPAIIFYNVYECGDKDNASSDVDTSKAGANVYVADGTENNVTGSYVARIYKSVELSEDGKSVVDSKKLHKYDGALYSKMSMNVAGNDGVLNINAENEGLDSELHLTVNGGIINIISGNDGINTNEDGVSVTTVNAGELNITVTGATGEGDGIDSNGWLVINGGTVRSFACATSGDAGIDSDMGIIINGGDVAATGNMLDAIDAASTQKYVIFNVRNGSAGSYSVKDADGHPITDVTAANAFSILIVSSPDLPDGLCALYNGDTLVASAEPGDAGVGGFGGRPGGFDGGRGERPDGATPPDGFNHGPKPDGTEPPEGMEPPDGTEGQPPELPTLPDGTQSV